MRELDEASDKFQGRPDQPRVPSQYSDLDDTTLEAIASNQVHEDDQGAVLEVDDDYTMSPTETLEEPDLVAVRGSKPMDATDDSREEILAPVRESSDADRMKRRSRASSEGSRSLSEDLIDGRSFLRALAMFAEDTDVTIAMELCKIDWELFSQVRVS
jgi:hypothetical protein